MDPTISHNHSRTDDNGIYIQEHGGESSVEEFTLKFYLFYFIKHITLTEDTVKAIKYIGLHN